ncbi:uncharacterized protein KY384_002060 [Bacidia gigantensis]|uniref:uncharacterized protein n=1 Tax=Bacidia gigantensis TaxID=2732470 RepID=UPI001D056A71|nr:uncharacterized protein KY384_002060 [Bacidia gigantensis]KAG8533277.1 hypothetical protein KY384_002060 [Bacidia gigantensis]
MPLPSNVAVLRSYSLSAIYPTDTIEDVTLKWASSGAKGTEIISLRVAVSRTTAFVRSKLPEKATTNAAVHPIPVYARNHPVHPLAYLKQARSQKSRWFSTQARNFVSPATKVQNGPRFKRSDFPISRISKTVQQGGISPFASTLRPNLTGGALPRSAGGYSLGGAGKARFFGHTAGCQAQVVNNVGAGVRAFVVGGGKVKYDGVNPTTGDKRFRSISAAEEKAWKQFARPLASIKGTTLEFKISPTLTALPSGLSAHGEQSLNTLQSPDLLTSLSGDFARCLRSLSSILNDLNRLSRFGDLPVSLSQDGTVIMVCFPGCDADLVTRLCEEVGVERGYVKEDVAWDHDKEVQMALLFPFAPEMKKDAEGYFYHDDRVEEEAVEEQQNWRDLLSPSVRTVDLNNKGDDYLDEMTLRSFMLHSVSPSGYESLEDPDDWAPSLGAKSDNIAPTESQDFEGVEGIYKFLQVCAESKR